MPGFWEDKRVVVTGGGGFLGSHLCDKLCGAGCHHIFVPRSLEYDLRYATDIRRMFDDAGRVDVLFHLAANVGGIGLNQAHPYLLCYENLMMGVQLIHQAIDRGVPKFVCVGTVCAYPKFAPVPFREENLWNGYPEETNAPYGLAKKMLLVLLQAARAERGFNGVFVLPTNLYGPRDNFNPQTCHVIPALIKKCLDAAENGDDHIVVWGTGEPTRDFLYVEDAAEGLLLAAEKWDRPEPINFGTGQGVKICALVHFIQKATGFGGRIVYDETKPDGQPQRTVSPDRAKRALGWEAKTTLQEGLRRTVEWYRGHREEMSWG